MPELPEVETICAWLEPRLLQRRVERVHIARHDVCTVWEKATSGRVTPRQLLKGGRVVELCRHGKQMALVCDDGRCVCIQLGMTGQMMMGDADTGASVKCRHVHVRWLMNDGTELAFRDPRRFGGITCLVRRSDLDARWAELGPDALTIRVDALKRGAQGSKRMVKALLLNQRVLAGVGNIYCDEALFLAGIHPETRCCELSAEKVTLLARTLRRVLRGAVRAGGSTLKDYQKPDGTPGIFQRSHLVYGRGGEPCTQCSHELVRAVVCQRGTVYCPLCQPV